jgi:putative transposase
MQASNFSDVQKAFIIKQGEDGTPVAEICRKAGINQATYFNWKNALLPHENVCRISISEPNPFITKLIDQVHGPKT